MSFRICLPTVVVLTGCLWAQSAESTGCALELEVRSPSGLTLSGIPVKAAGVTGKYSANTKSDERGLARFCDPPVDLSFELQVGAGGCAVTIHNVSLVWNGTRRVVAIYEGCRS